MSGDVLSEFVEATAAKFGIPGVAVGVWVDGEEKYACHGVTSIDNPLPVDLDTLYVLGSVMKTYTATALMRLVAEGRVELDASVRQYIPELQLTDHNAAAEITVMNLLNHTAGLDWGITVDTGEGMTPWPVMSPRWPSWRGSPHPVRGLPTARRGTTSPGGSWRRSRV